MARTTGTPMVEVGDGRSAQPYAAVINVKRVGVE
jgi:hypothetical protein